MNFRKFLSFLLFPFRHILSKTKYGCVDCGITARETLGLPFFSANKFPGEGKSICEPCFQIARKNGSLSRFIGYQPCDLCGLLGFGGVHYGKDSKFDYTCWKCYDITEGK